MTWIRRRTSKESTHQISVFYIILCFKQFDFSRNKIIGDKLVKQSVLILSTAIGHFCCTALPLPGGFILQLSRAPGCLHYWYYSTVSYRIQCEVIAA
jgi:hypothetical protein